MHRSIRRLVVAGTVLQAAFAGHRALGQTAAILADGDRIRVRVNMQGGPSIEGLFRGTTGTDLLLQSDSGSSLRRIPLAELTELRRADGTQRSTLAGAAIGYVTVGLVAGLAARSASATEDAVERVTAAGGLTGVAVGGLIGHGKRQARWVPVSLTAVRPALLPGMRVRLRTAREGWLEPRQGRVVQAGGDSLVFRPDAAPSGEVRFSRAEVVGLEWPWTRKRATGRGVAIGGVAGVLSGAILGAAAGSDCSSSSWFCFDSGELAIAGAVALGATGLLIGGTIGYFSHAVGWEGERNASRSLAVRPYLESRRLGVMGSLSF